jgi:hypothetical protein
VSAKSDPINRDGPEQVTHETVHTRFLALLKRDQDTGLSVPWKKALLEPPNPLTPQKRPHLKLPVLLAILILGTGITMFVWFSFLHQKGRC